MRYVLNLDLYNNIDLMWAWKDNLEKTIKSELGFRQLLLPARMAQFNDKLRSQDKFDLKYRLFTATFIIFNSSIAAIYWVLKGPVLSKLRRGLVTLSVFPLLHYQLNIHWMNAEFIRAFEHTQSPQAYYLRQQMMKHSDQYQLLSKKRKVWQKLNQDYQKIYDL